VKNSGGCRRTQVASRLGDVPDVEWQRELQVGQHGRCKSMILRHDLSVLELFKDRIPCFDAAQSPFCSQWSA
jgi:hypothetical protein